MSAPVGPPLLKMAEVARRLNVSKATAYRLAQTGELACVRFSKSTVRVRPQDLERFIDELATKNQIFQTEEQ